MLDNPQNIAEVLATPPKGDVVAEEYAIFNDPKHFEPLFASGQIHPMLREKLLEEPLWFSPVAGAAKRFMLWTNDQRSLSGDFVTHGFAVLRRRTVTTTPWEDVTGADLDAIDEGRRANG